MPEENVLNVKLTIPINDRTRTAFAMTCKANNTTMAEEIRRFVDKWIADHRGDLPKRWQ